MKEKETYKSIEELYRAKLGGRQYPVSEGMWPSLSRKLRFREFMRFNPGSFNIYYLAGIIIGTAIGVSLLTGNKIEQDSPVEDIIINTFNYPEEIERDTIAEEDTKDYAGVKEPGKESMDKTGKTDTLSVQQDNELSNESVAGDSVMPENSSDNRPVTDSSLKTEDKGSPVPVIGFEPDVKEGCVPLTVNFDNLSHNYDSCLWDFGDGGKSTTDNPVWIFDEEGSYDVSLILFGSNGTRLYEKQSIEAYPVPEARFEVSTADPYIPDEQIYFYNYSQNAVDWEWDLGDGTVSDEFEPTHFYDKPGSYTVKLKVISRHGCVDSMVLINAFEDNSCYIKFPNVFIPNEGGPTGGYYSARTDQQEQVFHPVCSGVTSYHLSIYSRRGVLMFETDNLEIGWDGYYKGQRAEPGVYIWKVRGIFKNGERFVKGGDVTLLPQR